MSESLVFTLYIRSGITRATVREKYRGAQGFLDRLRRLSEDPQHALPDIFIWMISGGRRVAYHRMKARSLLYRWECLRSALKDNLTIRSSIPEEAGSDCGIVQNILLKVLHTLHSYSNKALMVTLLASSSSVSVRSSLDITLCSIPQQERPSMFSNDFP